MEFYILRRWHNVATNSQFYSLSMSGWTSKILNQSVCKVNHWIWHVKMWLGECNLDCNGIHASIWDVLLMDNLDCPGQSGLPKFGWDCAKKIDLFVNHNSFSLYSLIMFSSFWCWLMPRRARAYTRLTSWGHNLNNLDLLKEDLPCVYLIWLCLAAPYGHSPVSRQ